MISLPGYFDYAAATPVDPAVVEAMKPYFSDKFFNPSSLYTQALQARDELAELRAEIGRVFGVKPSEVIFTSGGTEANNLAIHGVMGHFLGKKLLVSAIEHDSVLGPAKQYNHSLVQVDHFGRLQLDDLKTQIDDDVVLVSIMLANNEVGSIQPLQEISTLIADERRRRRKQGNLTPIYLHTDAAQAVQYIDCNVSRLGVDLMTVNSGKIYGPKQSGCLIVDSSVKLHPQVIGGGQEFGRRSGTESLALIAGFNKALEIVQKKRGEECKRLAILQKELISGLESLGAQINGPKRDRLVNNIHFTLPGKDNETILYQLDRKGFMVATGSACSALKDSTSHVLAAMGFDETYSRSSIRLSLGRFTTGELIGAFLDELHALLN